MHKIIIAVILFTAFAVYAQEEPGDDEPDILIGKSYKFELVDNSQIIGKVISADNNRVKIQTKNRGTVTIRRENILFISTDLTPEKFEFSFSLTGGIHYLNSQRSYYSRQSERGPHINAGAMFYINSSKAIKIDAAYSSSKPLFENDYYYAYYPEYPPPEPDKFEGGETVLFSFKPSFVLGTFKPHEKVIAYGTLGLGISFFKRNEIIHTYYSYNYSDSTYTRRVETIFARDETSAMLSLGGGFGYRITPNISILTEAEVNVIFERNDLGSHIPIRIGINYIIF